VSESDWEIGKNGSGVGDNSLSCPGGWENKVNSGEGDGAASPIPHASIDVKCGTTSTGGGAGEDFWSCGSNSEIDDACEGAGDKQFVRGVVGETGMSGEGAGDTRSLPSSTSSSIGGCDANWATRSTGGGVVNCEMGNKGDEDGSL